MIDARQFTSHRSKSRHRDMIRRMFMTKEFACTFEKVQR